MTDENKLRDLVAQVAAGYFSSSHVNPTEIPAVISQIAASLSVVKEPTAEDAAAAEAEQRKLAPAQIRKSITPEGLISFEDGKRYKTLKRHLSTRGLTPADYRGKWGLPKDYPIVAPSYSERRSALAKTLGLGQKGGLRSSKRAKPAAVDGAGSSASDGAGATAAESASPVARKRGRPAAAKAPAGTPRKGGRRAAAKK